MKWTNEQAEHLKELCYAGVSNADLAKEFGVTVAEIHAKRSALGITRAKCAAGKPEEVRTIADVEAEIKKVQDARREAYRKIERCDNRLVELGIEWGRMKEE